MALFVIVGIIVFLLRFTAGMFNGWGMMGPCRMDHDDFHIAALNRLHSARSVLGIVWLVRNLGASAPPGLEHAYPYCGQAVRVEWPNCPYCGTALT